MKGGSVHHEKRISFDQEKITSKTESDFTYTARVTETSLLDGKEYVLVQDVSMEIAKDNADQRDKIKSIHATEVSRNR